MRPRLNGALSACPEGDPGWLQERYDSWLASGRPGMRTAKRPDLADVSESQEQAAIDAGEIAANRISYVGQRR